MQHIPLPVLDPMPGGHATTLAGPLQLDVHFDASTLLLGLGFAGSDEVLCTSFPSVIGFRRLEGTTLASFRQAAGNRPGWLWRVGAGGWCSEPGMRDGLLEGALSALHEYLVLGTEEGVNVLCCGTPQVFPARP